MINVNLKNGHLVNIDENRLNNMELMDALADVDDGNTLAISKVCTLLLGQDEKKKLYDFFKKDGIVPIDKITESILEILNSIGQLGKK